MASRRQAALGAFWGTVERVTTQGVSFLVVLILARLLGPSAYGLVALAATIALFGQTLLGETFSEALVQAKELEPAHASSLFWLLVGAGLLAAAAVVLAADGLAGFFNQPDLAPVLRALSLLVPLTALQAVPTALFKRALNFRALAIASAGGTVIAGVTGVVLAFAGFGAWSLVANLLVQNAVLAAAIWRQSSFRPQLIYSHRHVRELWSYGQYMFLLRIAAFTFNQSPRILIGYFYDAAALGAFSLGLRIVETMIQLLALPASSVAVPVIARLRYEPTRLSRAILAATQITAMAALPAFIGFVLVAPAMVPLFFGPRWTSSVPIVQIIAVYGVAGAAALLWGGIVGGLGRPDLNLATTGAGAIVSVALMLAAAPWGLHASAIAFVVRGYITLPVMPVFIARVTGVSAWAQYRVFGPIILATATMAAAVQTLLALLGGRLHPLALLLGAVPLGAAAYVLGLFLFARPALRLGASVLGEIRPGPKPNPSDVRPADTTG
ncbi:MAG TPA: lipopolysaccharide biosynthesis protein [Candidatus Sulfotelmatobacter sp.]|nr:lipopolysaccharide biosynthesis protein [Candidatus Sulfotelmatobacter sp.]